MPANLEGHCHKIEKTIEALIRYASLICDSAWVFMARTLNRARREAPSLCLVA